MTKLLIGVFSIYIGLTLLILPGCDESKDKTIILPVSGSATTEGRMLVLFSCAVPFQGILGGRLGVDNLCKEETIAGGLTNVHGFISIDQVAIADLPGTFGYPTNLPIYGPDGLSNSRIADDWQDLMDGSIDVNLDDAGVMPTDETWWSNSILDGSIDTTYTGCNNFTVNDGSTRSTIGQSLFTDGQWINCGGGYCNQTAYLLCIGMK